VGTFVRIVMAAFALGAASCAEPPRVPVCADCNVVLISVDTLRADHVGAYGYARPTTPNIDALARRGVLFENAVSQSSWTRPAHMSIFTGLHPREHGFLAVRDARRLEPEVPTIASVLAANGWKTAGWSGGVNMAASFGFGQGFELYRNNGRSFRDNLEDARFWLDRNAGSKFFLFFHGYDAHTPYAGDEIDRRALGLGTRPRAQFRRACRKHRPSPLLDRFVDEYDAAIHRADRYVGKLVADLEKRGVMDRTILVLLSDHGEEFAEHGRCFHLATLHREVLHVPLLVVAPGLAPRRVPDLVSASVTIAPTLMELVGIAPHRFPGPSLAVAAAGGRSPERSVFSETEKARGTGGDGAVRSLTAEDRKLIDWPTLGRSSLFDLGSDLAEKRPLDEKTRRDDLLRELGDWMDAHPARFPERRRLKTAAEKQAAGAAGPREPARPGDRTGEGGDETGKPEDEADEPDDEAIRRREQQLRSLGYAE
jgi:arylsulfatase A-like enzyme